MAEGRRLRPALARRDRHAALQDHHRPNAPRPDSASTKGRGQGRLQGAQPHDRSRHARLSKARLKPPGAPPLPPDLRLCTNAPGIIIEVGFVEMLREGEGWRKGETWSSRVNPDGPIDPEASKIHRIRPGDLKNAPRFPTILPKVKDFVGESPIVAHAYKNERDFLDYEFARAKVIQWGESAYAEGRYICTQVLFAQLFPGASKSLTSMCDRLALDRAKETTGTAHCWTPT